MTARAVKVSSSVINTVTLLGEVAVKVISLAGITWVLENNVDTDSVFKKVFEKVKYFRKVFKYKYF